MKEVTSRVEQLTNAERLSLPAQLVEKIRATGIPETPQCDWLDLCGLVEFPALGEDAQAWASRTRREEVNAG